MIFDDNLLINSLNDSPNILFEYYNNFKEEKYIETIDLYHQEFLISAYENKNKNFFLIYFDHIISDKYLINNKNIWNILIDNLDSDNVLVLSKYIFDAIFMFSNELDFNVNILCKLFDDKLINIITYQDCFWTHDDNFNFKYIISKLLSQLEFNKNISSNINKIIPLVLKIINSYDNEIKYLKWLIKIIELNYSIMNFELHELPCNNLDPNIDLFLINIILLSCNIISYKLLNDDFNKQEIEQAYIKYIDHSTIHNDNELYKIFTQNNKTQYYYIILNLYRIFNISINKKIEETNSYIFLRNSEGQNLDQENIVSLYDAYSINNKYIKLSNNINDCYDLNNIIFDFYKYILVDIYTHYKKHIVDDVLYDIYAFMFENYFNCDSVSTNIILNISINIINSNKYTHNPNLKILVADFLCKIIVNDDTKDDFNDKVKNFDKHIMKIAKYIISLCNNINNYPMDDIDKTAERNSLYKIIFDIHNKVPLSNKVFIKNNEGMYLLNNYINDLDLIHQSNDEINIEDDIIYILTISNDLYQMIKKLNNFILQIDYFKKLITQDEFLNSLNNVIIKIINKYYLMFNGDILDKNIIDLISAICETIIILNKNSDKYLNSLIDTTNFNIKYISSLISEIPTPEAKNMIKIIQEHSNISKDNSEVIDNIPDEFIDQITCSLIKNPIMIPNIDMIFDKATIIKCVMNNNTNPYTREKLTLDELYEYNKKDDIKKKIHDFNKTYNDWICNRKC